MSKYLEVAKLLFKAQIIWRFDVAMSVVFTVSKIAFAYLLWGAVFGENITVSGFTFPAMISYYIISSFLSQIEMSEGVSREIGERIKEGSFSKYMVLPVNIQRYFISQTFGAMSFYSIFNLASAILWKFIFNIDFVLTSNIWVIPAALLMVILGLIFMIQLNYFLGLLAFKFEDIGFFLMVKNNIVSFITGTLIPLVLLPHSIVSFMRFFPFYYVTYLPSMLLIGRNEDEAVVGIIILMGWISAFAFFNKIAYGKLRVAYDGVGI